MSMRAPFFRSGDIVEIKPLREIQATLDADGALDGVPFMPEMHAFCGRRFRVFKRADKICSERAYYWDLRRMKNAVLLEEVRCDGGAHDGCGRMCTLFWKEAWLRPAPAGAAAESIDWVQVMKNRTSVPYPPIDDAKVYSCQATALVGASEHLRMWDPRPYARDLRTGALTPVDVVKVVARMAYNWVAGHLGYWEYGRVLGSGKKTPAVELGLRPGELVRIRRKEEVAATLDARGRNRGLGFGDTELSRHCGSTHPVLSRIDRMILEDSGKMRKIDNTVLLQGTACSGMSFRGCARHGHPMWREAWLERAPKDE